MIGVYVAPEAVEAVELGITQRAAAVVERHVLGHTTGASKARITIGAGVRHVTNLFTET